MLIRLRFLLLLVILFFCFAGCKSKSNGLQRLNVISPTLVSFPVKHDADDPAIWIHPMDPAKSLVLGTDKDRQGGLVVYDLDGNVVKLVLELQRPNNVDVEYSLVLNGKKVDIAIVTERVKNRLRIFKLPEMIPVDRGGIEVFEGEEEREPMGISLYRKRPNGEIYAIVSRKAGPTNGTYLWQYLLEDDGQGFVKASLVRKFGEFSGKNEIEAIAVDDELGYVYYSDEGVGVRKYYADPDHNGANTQLAIFGTKDFIEDHEGIAIYKVYDGTGYILVSDQQGNRFQVFKREGEKNNPHDHQVVCVVDVKAEECDGCEVTNARLNDIFTAGLFVAMSNDRTFHYYSWPDIAGKELTVAPDGDPYFKIQKK